MKNLMRIYQSRVIILVIAIFGSLAAQAGEVTSTFSPGGTLTATQMNEIKDAVNDNNSNIGTNTTAIGDNAADIGTNNTNIGINDSAITDHESRITVLEGNSSGIEGTRLTASVNITSTTSTSILSLSIPESGIFDVALNAHVSVEISGSTVSRLILEIRNSSCSGAVLGQAMWRPGGSLSDSTFNAVSLPVTGFEASVAGPVTYVLCSRKFEASFPNASIFFGGFNLTYTN